MIKPTMNYKVLGISSGIGVSLYPFKRHVIGNIEFRPIFHTPGNEQWEANFPGIPLFKSKKAVLTRIPQVDVILSSPDCGSGSILRMSRAKEYGDHKKNDSLSLFIWHVKVRRPKFFLMENLDALFKSFPEAEFNRMFEGYTLIKHVAPVSMWGNSQITRIRLVVVGIRNDLPVRRLSKYFQLPDYRHKNKPCRELYGDLEKLGFDDNSHLNEDLKELTTIHAGRKITNLQIQEIWNTELKGERRWKVVGRKFTTAPGVYRNRLNDYPATARKANRQYDHLGRMLTPRQLARIQGLPDDFKIVVKKDKLNYWLNKARAAVTKTPPYEISHWFKRKLDKTYHLWNSVN